MIKINAKFIACWLLAAATCLESGVAQQVKPVKKQTLGATKNVHQAGNLYFAGQFTKDDMPALSKAKIERVITLRTDGEVRWDEQAAVEAAGMKFIKVPFMKLESLTDEVFGKVRKLLRDKSKTTLLHCGSATRVGAVWLPYRVLDEGVDLETAIKEAKEIGLKAPVIREKAVEYIKRQQAKQKKDNTSNDQSAAVMNGEKSVKPGINKGYKDPDLDISKMVDRFELESREVYVSRNDIVAACEVKEGMNVADVGAGTGFFSRMFSQAVGDQGWVFAVDIAPRMVGHITTEAAKQNLRNITGVVCAENDVTLPANSIDFVFICDVYHHFEFPKSTMSSIHRALKPEGRLVVIDFERIEGKSRDWLLGHVRAGKEVFRAEIQDAGFSLVEEKKIPGFKENYFLMFRKSEGS